MAKTANEEFLDALIRHQIYLLRLDATLRNQLIAILDRSEKDLARQIRDRLRGIPRGMTPANVRRLKSLMKVIGSLRGAAMDEFTKLLTDSMKALALAEPEFTDRILKTAVPATLETAIPAADMLRAIVSSHPFQGRVLREWTSALRATDLKRIEDRIKIGMTNGATSDEIARSIVGTRRLNGTNGVTQLTRNDATSLTRTAVNSIANEARNAFFGENSDLFDKELFVATLDSRTTPQCRSLDGEVFERGKGPIPPIHWNCRSLRVAMIDDEAIGNRPARAFTQQQLLREFAQRNGFRAPRTREGLPRGTRGRFDQFARVRMREMTGQIPARVTYEVWLRRQSAAFQDDVLGRTRGALFRRGGLTLDKFVDANRHPLTLDELRRFYADAFVKAGLG